MNIRFFECPLLNYYDLKFDDEKERGEEERERETRMPYKLKHRKQCNYENQFCQILINKNLKSTTAYSLVKKFRPIYKRKISENIQISLLINIDST